MIWRKRRVLGGTWKSGAPSADSHFALLVFLVINEGKSLVFFLLFYVSINMKDCVLEHFKNVNNTHFYTIQKIHVLLHCFF